MQLQIARKNALITHAHINGINGAIMQAMAVHTALCIEPPNLEPSSFIDQLTDVAEKLEQSTTEERLGSASKQQEQQILSINR